MSRRGAQDATVQTIQFSVVYKVEALKMADTPERVSHRICKEVIAMTVDRQLREVSPLYRHARAVAD
jgi:hypothetical protein